MKKYYLVMINLILLFIENVVFTLLIYDNPTQENILNTSGTIIGILIGFVIAIIILVFMENVSNYAKGNIEKDGKYN